MEASRKIRLPVSDSLSSPSLTSEPPDIGNWFASYGYESPVLPTNNALLDSVSREAVGHVIAEENNKDAGENEKSRCEDELDFVVETENPKEYATNHKNQSSSEVHHSSCTQLDFSEPPDVRNWFSSYAYDSFVLDTNDDVKESVSDESESEKEAAKIVGVSRESKDSDEISAGECSGSKDKKSISKHSAPMESASLFTEPPDLKHWFSSYAYESPILNTCDRLEDGHCQHLERELNEGELIVEDSEGEDDRLFMIKEGESRDEKTDLDIDNAHSSEFVEDNSTFGVDKQDKGSIHKGIRSIKGTRTTPTHNNMCFVETCKEGFEDKTLGSSDMSPCKKNKSSFNDGSSMHTTMVKSPQEACSVSLHLSPSSGNNSISPPLIEKISEATDNQIGGLSNGTRKQIHRSDDKENQNTENGFVAVKKKQYAGTKFEDTKLKPQSILVEATRNKRTAHQTNESEETLNRRVLAETTNIQHFDSVGVTGKWKCPQKSKPDRGPPLKQLRLERWVYKV